MKLRCEQLIDNIKSKQMKGLKITWIAFQFLCSYSLGQQSSEPIMLINANIVDIERMEIYTGNLEIENGRIKDIYLKPPEKFSGKKYNLNGKFVVPGLSDLHTHSLVNFGPNLKADYLGFEKATKLYLYCGITTILDLFNQEELILGFRDSQKTSNATGARMFCAGPIFTAPGGHGTEYGIPTRTINSPDEAREEVSDFAQKRPDVIKLVYDHSYSRFPTISKETLASAIKTAKEFDLKTVVHIGSWQDAEDAILQGADMICHTPQGLVPDSFIRLAQESAFYFNPTLSVHQEFYNITTDTTLLEDRLLKEISSIEIRESYKLDSFPQGIESYRKMQGNRISDMEFSIKKILKAGTRIKFVTGTDSGNIGTFHGYTLHRELELMVNFGFSEWEALKASTIIAGEFLDQKFGIKIGLPANLIILNASPISNIKNTRMIYGVMQNGKWVDREILLK